MFGARFRDRHLLRCLLLRRFLRGRFLRGFDLDGKLLLRRFLRRCLGSSSGLRLPSVRSGFLFGGHWRSLPPACPSEEHDRGASAVAGFEWLNYFHPDPKSIRLGREREVMVWRFRARSISDLYNAYTSVDTSIRAPASDHCRRPNQWSYALTLSADSNRLDGFGEGYCLHHTNLNTMRSGAAKPATAPPSTTRADSGQK